MKRNWLLTMALSVVAVLASSCGSEVAIERESDFNFDWKFTELADTVTLKNLPLADSDWRDIRLPHDWSVEHSFSEDLEGCTGYLPGGVGVYQKHFTTTENAAEKSTFVLFDGVYNNAKYWLNGEYIGENPYGYSPTYFNLTDVLKPIGEENILTVYVDHSRYADSRWYTGSGIYRNVKLITLDKLHIPIWGTYVTTPEITDAEATVNIEVTLKNEYPTESAFTLSTKIIDGTGAEVATISDKMTLAAGGDEVKNQVLKVTNPKLWDTENPNMYKAVTTIALAGEKVDDYTTPFGIRTIEFDKDKGFFLNGVSTYAKGVCLHHDGGLVGAAVPKGVWERRLKLIKKSGCNAIRTAHNPVSEEFLDLCDELGFLVQDEIFDEMDSPKDKRFNLNERETLYRTEGYDHHFQEWSESDLKRTVMRDRNHPSVFEWSIGNEIEWTYPEYKYVSGLWDPGTGGYWNKIPHLTPEQMKERYDNSPKGKFNLAETSKRLANWVRELDLTRPVTSNLIIPVASCVTGYADALDIVGISHQVGQYGWLYENHPDMHFTGHENGGSYADWKSVLEYPGVFSIFMWTGVEYLGEANLRWPRKTLGGMYNLAGFKKQTFDHFKCMWVDEPQIEIYTHAVATAPKKGDPGWETFISEERWNYNEGDMIAIEVMTNQPSATLYINGRSLGEKSFAEDHEDWILRWEIPYEAGILEARTGDIKDQLQSAGKAAALDINLDRSTLAADGYDVAHIEVQLVDAEGILLRGDEQRITFEIDGDMTLMGVDSGWNQSTQDFQSNNVVTYMGRCLAIVQSQRDKKGNVTLTVSAEGVPSRSFIIAVK